MQALTSVMPADAAKLIGEQLMSIVQTSGGKKGFGLLVALGIALYGAMKAASAVITALNIAYEEKETRGFIKLNLLALAITVAAVVMVVIAMISIAGTRSSRHAAALGAGAGARARQDPDLCPDGRRGRGGGGDAVSLRPEPGKGQVGVADPRARSSRPCCGCC
jgi:hypothetical protein